MARKTDAAMVLQWCCNDDDGDDDDSKAMQSTQHGTAKHTVPVPVHTQHGET